MTSLNQIVVDWFRTQRIEGHYDGWIFDDGMIWKPFHRYWFCVNDNDVGAYDNGSFNLNYAVKEDPITIPAADPYFFEKFNQLLTIRS